MIQRTPHAVALDLETTGLHAPTDLILEVGIVIVDEALTPIDIVRAVSVSTEATQWCAAAVAAVADGRADYVQNMHVANGLAAEIVAYPRAVVDDTWYLPTLPAMAAGLAGWLDDRHATGHPMVGFSVGSLDRPFLQQHMPELNAAFSYRNADVSGVLEVIKILDNDLGTRMRDELNKLPTAHRTVEDALDSVLALKVVGAELGITAAPFIAAR